MVTFEFNPSKKTHSYCLQKRHFLNAKILPSFRVCLYKPPSCCCRAAAPLTATLWGSLQTTFCGLNQGKILQPPVKYAGGGKSTRITQQKNGNTQTKHCQSSRPGSLVKFMFKTGSLELILGLSCQSVPSYHHVQLCVTTRCHAALVDMHEFRSTRNADADSGKALWKWTLMVQQEWKESQGWTEHQQTL